MVLTFLVDQFDLFMVGFMVLLVNISNGLYPRTALTLLGALQNEYSIKTHYSDSFSHLPGIQKSQEFKVQFRVY